MSVEVLCVGLATADTVVSLPNWPTPDGRVVTDAIVRAGGGPAATAAVVLARLGHASAIVGAVGSDAAGADVRAGLAVEGVDVTHLVTLEGSTAESVILLDRSAGTRTILHYPGVGPPVLDDAARRAGEHAAWVHADHAGALLVDGVEPARRSLDEGHPIDPLSLDGVGLYAPSAPALRARFLGLSLRAATRAALVAGARRVVVTLGAEGALAADGSGAWRVRSATVPIVSTLGAGDVFHGALLASLLDGHDLASAARRANMAAAMSCAALDGRTAIPRREALDAALATAPDVEPVLLEPRS